jgi:hypothetical protein
MHAHGSPTCISKLSYACTLTAAIAGLLNIQRPLQVLLETLFDKVKAQADTMALFAKQLDSTSSAAGLADRLAFLETRFSDVFGPPGAESPLSPFRQREMAERVQRLEGALAQHGHDVAELQAETREVRRRAHFACQCALHPGSAHGGGRRRACVAQIRLRWAARRGSPAPLPVARIPQATGSPRMAAGSRCARPRAARVQGLQPRVAELTRRLRGVDNLAGRALALDALAAELDVAVPQLDAVHRGAATSGDFAAAVAGAAAQLRGGGGSGSVGREAGAALAACDVGVAPPGEVQAGGGKAGGGVIARLRAAVRGLTGDTQRLQRCAAAGSTPYVSCACRVGARSLRPVLPGEVNYLARRDYCSPPPLAARHAATLRPSRAGTSKRRWPAHSAPRGSCARTSTRLRSASRRWRPRPPPPAASCGAPCAPCATKSAR